MAEIGVQKLKPNEAPQFQTATGRTVRAPQRGAGGEMQPRLQGRCGLKPSESNHFIFNLQRLNSNGGATEWNSFGRGLHQRPKPGVHARQ